MTKAYVYKDDTFDYWRTNTNLHSDQIGDPDQKQLNSALVTAFANQQYLTDHDDTISVSVSGVTPAFTVTITGSTGYSLRPGMMVTGYVGSTKVTHDYCSIQSMTYSGAGVVITLSHELFISPSPTTVIFNFYATVTSNINDLEAKKLNRNGDRMTEALTIDSLTSATGTLVSNELNFDLVNVNTTTVNAFGAATAITLGATTGTATVRNANVTIAQTGSGTTTVNSPTINMSTGATGVVTIISTKNSTASSNGALVVAGGTGLQGTLNVAGIVKLENVTDNTLGVVDGAVQLSGGFYVAKNATIGQDLRIKGSDITIEGNPTILATVAANPVGLFTTSTGLISVGLNSTSSLSVAGNVTLNTDTSNTVLVKGSGITTTATTFGIVNATATTVNLGGAATAINVGAATGTTTFTSATTSSTSANGSVVFNGGVGVKGTINIAGVSKFENVTDNTLGSADGATQMSGGLYVAKNVTIGQDLRIKGADIAIEGAPLIRAVTTTNAVGVFDTTTGAITIGAGATTTQTIHGNVTINTNSSNTTTFNAGTVVSAATTLAAFNTTSTTVNAFGAATTLNIGSGSGITNFAGNVNLLVGKEYQIAGVQKLFATGLGPTVVSSSLTSVGVLINLTVAGNTAVNGGDLTTTSTVASLFNTTATTLSIGGAATTVSIGAGTGTTTVNNDLNLANGKVFKINSATVVSSTGLGAGVVSSSLTSVGTLTSLTVSGNTTLSNGNLITGAATSNVFNTTATTLNIGGAATTVSIGAGTGSTTVNNNLVVNTADFGSVASSLKFTATVASTSPTAIFSIDKTIYRSAEVIIQAKQGTSYSVTKLIMIQDGTTSFESEYASLGTPLGTFNSDIYSNNWTMNVTQTAATSTEYKIFITAVKV